MVFRRFITLLSVLFMVTHSSPERFNKIHYDFKDPKTMSSFTRLLNSIAKVNEARLKALKRYAELDDVTVTRTILRDARGRNERKDKKNPPLTILMSTDYDVAADDGLLNEDRNEATQETNQNPRPTYYPDFYYDSIEPYSDHQLQNMRRNHLMSFKMPSNIKVQIRHRNYNGLSLPDDIIVQDNRTNRYGISLPDDIKVQQKYSDYNGLSLPDDINLQDNRTNHHAINLPEDIIVQEGNINKKQRPRNYRDLQLADEVNTQSHQNYHSLSIPMDMNEQQNRNDDLSASEKIDTILTIKGNKIIPLKIASAEKNSDKIDNLSNTKISLKAALRSWKKMTKKAMKLCIKACKKASKEICKEYKCSSSMKKDMKKECKEQCEDYFI